MRALRISPMTIFRVNSAMHPDSWNVWDSLGDGYARLGRKAEAIAAYRESLRLNPASTSATAALERLARPATGNPR